MRDPHITTGKEGTYVAALLPIGHYTVRVEAKGFRSFAKTGIELNIRDQQSVNAILTVGARQNRSPWRRTLYRWTRSRLRQAA